MNPRIRSKVVAIEFESSDQTTGSFFLLRYILALGVGGLAGWLANLMGNHGLVTMGWLERIRPKVYRISRSGRDALSSETESTIKLSYDRDHTRLVAQLLRSEVVRKFEANRKADVT